jgi:arginine utilization protein RocB
MELNDSFCEQVGDEITPPPTSLMMRDLKTEYSVQIPHTAVSMYNLLMMNRSFSKLHEKLVQIAKEAAINVETFYQERVQRYNQFLSFAALDFKVNVFTYQELLQKAISKYGDKEIERRIYDLSANRGDKDDRDFSTKIIADLAGLCREYSPMIIVFYSPPYYPAVSSKEDMLIQKTVGEVITHAEAKYQIELKQQHYFPGLCDLSFVQLTDKEQSVTQLTANMPLHGNHYHLPLQEIQSLNIPVLNIGPVGRDPHKWTERLHLPYTFDIFPELLSLSIKTIFAD